MTPKKSQEELESIAMMEFEEIAADASEACTDVRCSQLVFVEGLRLVITRLQADMDEAVSTLDSGL